MRRLPTRTGVVRRLRPVADAIDERLPHGRRIIPYEGFELVYSRRTSVVERLVETGAYEPEVREALAAELARSRSRCLVDVGANVGLVTLAALADVPDARIFAFEPGRHQRDLLAETIRRNGLGDRISLSPFALGERPGTASFAVHSSRHAAGDGFRDTGRGGRARLTTVEVDTLDRWWERSGRPSLDVLKLDTEGSELLVLRGAEAVLAACRPVLVLEIQEENLWPYPFGAEQVREEVDRAGYELEPLTRADYLARPR
jgi:FkbM family methyltransferase